MISIVSSISILCFLITSYASASLSDRVRTAFGTGLSQERFCVALLETSVEHAPSTGNGASYALNSFRAFAGGLKVEAEKPELHSGYTIVENGQSVAGSLTTEEVSARTQGILKLKANSDSVDASNEEQLKYIAFSTSDGVPAEKILSSIVDRLTLAKKAEAATTPISLFLASMLTYAYAAMVKLAIENPGAYTAFGLVFLYFFTDGISGLNKVLPGYHAVPNFYSDLSQFLANNRSLKRSFFMLSESVEIREELLKRSLELNDPNARDWNEIDKQYYIVRDRLPYRNMFKLLNLDETIKTVWLHTDMLIEKAPDGGEPEVHFLIQFSQKKPDFPKKPKQVEELVLNPQSGRLTPVPIPIRPSNH